jgi:two-component system OmpR family response regulator
MRLLIADGRLETAAKLLRVPHGVRMGADIAAVGEDALRLVAARQYDVVILDAALPGIDGFEVCRRLREDGVRTPVLMLIERDAADGIIPDPGPGVDDWLVKPFTLDELIARIGALARCGPGGPRRARRSGTVHQPPGIVHARMAAGRPATVPPGMDTRGGSGGAAT